jgi:ribonucleoside-diphosphate reductase alpha chain
MRFDPAGMTDDPDIRIASSVMDYIFRRLALDFLPYDKRAELGVLTTKERAAALDAEAGGTEIDVVSMRASAPVEQPAPEAAKEEPRPTTIAHTSTELVEAQQGTSADAPLCFTCGTKMRQAGSCYVCEGCGSTSGCS